MTWFQPALGRTLTQGAKSFHGSLCRDNELQSANSSPVSPPAALLAYFLNLDTALDRRVFIEEAFAGTGLKLRRVPAIAGDSLSLPVAEYSEARFRWFHGRSTNPREVGCYLSHVRAISAFLETDEAHALFCEDDIVLQPRFEEVLATALQHAESWNVLRLAGLSAGRSCRMASLGGGYDLRVELRPPQRRRCLRSRSPRGARICVRLAADVAALRSRHRP